MHSRSSLGQRQRELLVDLFEQGHGYRAAATVLGVKPDLVRILCRRWKLHGRICLMRQPHKQSYSFEVKKQVVERFLAGETYMELASEFAVSSQQLVQRWVYLWRQGGDEALMPKPKGRRKDSCKPRPMSEEDKLRRRVEQLEAENAYLKTLRDLTIQGRE